MAGCPAGGLGAGGLAYRLLGLDRGARDTHAMRIAVIGHAEHVAIAPVDALPAAGEILHLDAPVVIAGGGGGVAFFQFARSDAEVHFFTALGNDGAAVEVERQIRATGAAIHAMTRDAPHTRDVVLVTPDGERTIIVVGEPLHPRRDDPLPWQLLAGCDAAYFTARDPELLKTARAARLLVVTARRREALIASGARADVVIGSARDPRERSALADYHGLAGAVVMTDGARGGSVETSKGARGFDAPPLPMPPVGAYGAGDTFAAALTYYVAAGMELMDAAGRAAAHGAAVLRGANPLDHQLRLVAPPSAGNG